jgi:hypothetical protein
MVSTPNFYYKDSKGTNVAICVPVRDYVTSSFTFSLSMLMKKCGETNQKTSLHMVMGSEVAMQRQQLVEQALETACTHILWLDSDMLFPSNLLQALLSHEKDIIACNYSTRVEPHRPVAFDNPGNLDSRVLSGEGLQSVFAVGAGCMLVKRQVYEQMPRPHYSVTWNDDYSNMVGEDIFFCEKAREHGYEIWVEKTLSNSIGHSGTKIYTLKGDCNV